MSWVAFSSICVQGPGLTGARCLIVIVLESMHLNIQLAVTVVSGAVALLSILLSARANRSNTELQARLQSEIEQRHVEATKSARLEEVISRYRDPLLGSAFELQSGIFNIRARRLRWIFG